MNNFIRATVFVIGGLLWFAFALAFGFVLVQYVSDGAGIQFFTLSVSSGSVLLGMIQVIGFLAAAGLCCVVGVGLCVHGLVPPVRKQAQRTLQNL